MKINKIARVLWITICGLAYLHSDNLLGSTLPADFQSTWTLIVADFNATYSTLNTIQTQGAANSSGTYTVLAADFGGTWTTQAAILSAIAAESQGTFTVLGEIGSTLGQGATISGTLLSIYDTVVNDANGTFTALNADFQGTWSLITASSNAANFQGTYTLLQTIINDQNGTFTALNADFQGTWSLIVADAHGTFSALNADFQGTWSLIVADFKNTWTMLGNVATILGQGATISGTLFDIIETTTVLYQNAGSPIVINPSPFTTTYNISLPGRYIVPYNLTFNPASAQPAILISANNVELDFLGSILTQGNLTSGVNAVSIASGFNDIYIHNGKIEYFTGIGIVGNGNQRLQIESTLSFSCDTSAIQLTSVSESRINNCNMLGCCQGATGNIVLNMTYCTDINVENCILNDNGINTNNLLGVSIANCLKCKFQNIAANDNTAGSDFRAYAINQSTLCSFADCETKNCQSQATNTDGAARGFVVGSASSANIFSDCVALALMASATIDGFLSTTICDDNLFFNCQSSLHTTTNPTGITNGFQVVNNMRNELSNCIAHYNSAQSLAVGFQINTCSSAIIENCEAQSQAAIFTNTATLGALTAVSGSPFSNGGSDPQMVVISPLASGNLFVGAVNDTTANISMFIANPITGVLTAAPGSPFATNHNNPFGMAFSPVVNGNLFVAAVSIDGSGNQIPVFLVNQTTGALTQVSGSPFTGTAPAMFDVTFSPVIAGNLYAATANFTTGATGAISIFSVNQTTGAFSEVSGSPFAPNITTQGVAFSPIVTGTNLFVAVTDTNNSTGVYVYVVNPYTGHLTQVSGSPFSTGGGSMPYNLSFSPVVEGNLFAATANSGNSTVSVWSVNPLDGYFTPVSGSPFSVRPGPTTIAFSPLVQGNLFAIVAYNGNGVDVYNVNLETGNFSPVPGNPFSTGGNTSWSAAYSPLVQGNLFAAALNQGQGTTAMFQVTLPSVGATPGAIGFWSFQNSSAATTGCTFKNNEALNNGFGFRLDFLSSNIDTVFLQNIAMKNATNFNANFPAGAYQSVTTEQLNTLTTPWVNIGIS